MRKRKKTGTTFADKLVRLLALVLALMLVLGFLAGRFDPREYPYIPFFGLAYPFVLFLNVLMIAWWLLRRRWVFALGTLVLILCGQRALHATFGLIGSKGEGPKAKPEHIRMMTYNVHAFRPYGLDATDSVRHEMLEVIRKEDPDIICFQEYFSRNKGSYAMTDSLKRILRTRHFYFQSSNGNSYEAFGLAIFSRYPIKGTGVIEFSENSGSNASIYADLLVQGRQIRVYNVHLQSISFKEQDYDYIDKVSQHMDAEIVPSRRILGMLKRAFIKRSAQVDIMKQNLDSCKTPFLIAGDFNDTPASYAVARMTHSLKNTFVEQGTGLGRTYNGKFPNFQIDYISATKEFRVLNHRVIEAKLSDHFPVRSDLRLNF
ncbi:endonuclease/exonuclease/phosphatase family protein [Pedobacter sp. JY14-1]|uniref:endonuclease/exonuclease/phosphatase family protein n=1 Tax=Pedobacter sp. JY14-1 TaxID=3034151 RepID=UPI0023E334E0|nr:endonuclease/exonuclease/phosphatase family protein [Pedobacter sp. JY14-1]